MPFSFKNILIPVDLTLSSEVAVKKALELADKGATINLLHIQKYTLPGLKGKENIPDFNYIIEQRLNRLKDKIEENENNINVYKRIMSDDSIQKAIERSASELAVDIIIIGKKSHHSWLPFLNTVVPSKIAQKTGIPVLTVKPGATYSKKIKTMVVPVTSETVKNKMEIISAICGKFKVKIHLATFTNNQKEPSQFTGFPMLQMYQWLQSIRCPVEYIVLQGSNKARAILTYAEKINADILIVHPESETKIGWPNKHISDMLPSASKVQVWTV